MSDALIAQTVSAQVDLIRVSLTPCPLGAGTPQHDSPAAPDVAWFSAWKRACDGLTRVERGTPEQCTALVWRQIDLAADLSGQPWWTSPRLQRAAVGEIAWATTLGPAAGDVPSTAAQRQWEQSHLITDAIREHPTTPTLGHPRRQRERLTLLAGLRRDWEDAWWHWVTTHQLSTPPARPAALVTTASSGP